MSGKNALFLATYFFDGKICYTKNSDVAKIDINKTRQGYTRKRILKLAGYFFPGMA